MVCASVWVSVPAHAVAFDDVIVSLSTSSGWPSQGLRRGQDVDGGALPWFLRDPMGAATLL